VDRGRAHERQSVLHDIIEVRELRLDLGECLGDLRRAIGGGLPQFLF
jgi:hypothetical protein